MIYIRIYHEHIIKSLSQNEVLLLCTYDWCLATTACLEQQYFEVDHTNTWYEEIKYEGFYICITLYT